MPTYEYKCDACGHAFEQFHSIVAAPIRKCPACKKLKVKRLISTGAGLIFKGSGFYITDYRDQSYTDKAKADSGSGAGGATDGAAAATSGEGKPAGADAKPTGPDAKPAGVAPPTNSDAKPAAGSSPAQSTGAAKPAANDSGKKRK